MTSDTRLAVEQCDRDAAKAFWNAQIAGWQEATTGQRALTESFARHRINSTAPAQEAQQRVSVKDGEWFYPEGNHSSDECRFSPDEVIEYALEGDDVSQVVAIERAAALPTVYAAVRVWSDAEKDARESDDDYDYTLHATVEEARATLTSKISDFS